MARKVDRIPARNGSKYPWNEWLDGDMRELAQGEDFTISASQLARSAWAAANRRRVDVTIRVRGDKVYIQALLNGEGARP